MRKLFHALHRWSTASYGVPLVAALSLVAVARVSQWVGPAQVLAPAPAAEPSGDLKIIDGVLARRGPNLGVTLRRQLAQAISEEAEIAGYDPLLVLAIIDVESDFEDDAVSVVGARGLMQIRPSTLQFVAEKQGLRLTRDEVAADTALQVRLGIRYLRQLQDRFKGDLDLALMAYNAGPSRIRQAIKERDLEQFRRYPHLVQRDFRSFREGQGLEGDWALAQREPVR